MSAPIRYYCIAHEDFEWRMPDFMTMIGTGGYVPERGIAMSRDFPDIAHMNQHYGEYMALFAIRRILVDENATGFVGVCHYRRFAIVRQLGFLMGFNLVTAPQMVGRMTTEDFVHDRKTPIIPSFVNFPGTVMAQFAAESRARDLMHFFGCAIDTGVIDDGEAALFLSRRGFITAPSCCYIPVEWFVDIMKKLEIVMSRYYRHYWIERDGAANRSMAFCTERLQAYLLEKKAKEWGYDKVIARPLTLVVPVEK
jgi:hypothetical protein